MTVQSVIKDVTAFVGVRPPNGSVFQTAYVDRTAWEFVNLANEMAQRIAYDTRDWQVLRARAGFLGTGTHPPADQPQETVFSMPADYQRMLLTSQVWTSRQTHAPMSFISDADDWLRKELQGYVNPIGEWTIFGNEMHVRPVPAAGEKIMFYYMRNTCVKLASGGFGTQFLTDADTFVLPERLLKLGMQWQWKANKGASYAEDIANYEDALAKVAGADKPSPIFVGSQAISSDAVIACYGDVPSADTFVGPPR